MRDYPDSQENIEHMAYTALVWARGSWGQSGDHPRFSNKQMALLYGAIARQAHLLAIQYSSILPEYEKDDSN